jgi:hypothetical protein
MKHSYKIIPEENLVTNTIQGAFTYGEYRTLMDRIINDERFRPSMDMFWDFRNGTLAGFSNEEIAGIKDYIRRNQERRGDNYRVAFLVKEVVDYGLSRMYQMISQDLPVNFEVFYDEQEAMDWIKAKS